MNLDLHQYDQDRSKSRKWHLPWWGVIVAYILIFLSVIVGSFFCLLYSLEWGSQKSTDWLLSLVFSVCETVIVIQPIKVEYMLVHIIFYYKRNQPLVDSS